MASPCIIKSCKILQKKGIAVITPAHYANVLWGTQNYSPGAWARSYSVTPTQARPGAFYRATFRDSRGKRITRGLGTGDQDLAELICSGLVYLHNQGVTDPAQSPTGVSYQAVRLYFDIGRGGEAVPVGRMVVPDALAT